MAELAVRVETMSIHAAGELLHNAELRHSRWLCMGCGVAMTAAAADPEREFQVSPYFSPDPSHADDCPGDRFISEEGRSRGGQLGPTPPTQLILGNVAPRADAELEANPGPDHGRRLNRNIAVVEAVRRRKSTATSLHLIAYLYLTRPDLHDEPLLLPGRHKSTYRGCFWELRASAPDKERVVIDRILYSKIRFNKLVEANDALVLTLDSGVRNGNLTTFYKLKFALGHITANQAEAVRSMATYSELGSKCHKVPKFDRVR